MEQDKPATMRQVGNLFLIVILSMAFYFFLTNFRIWMLEKELKEAKVIKSSAP